MEHIRYKKETEVVTFQGREITLENLSPVFTPEQEAVKRRELEQLHHVGKVQNGTADTVEFVNHDFCN